MPQFKRSLATFAVVVGGALAGITALLGLSGTPGVVTIVLGVVLAMVSTFTVADPTPRGRVVTQLCLPASMLAAVVLSSLLDTYRVPSLVVFVLLMVAVVWARRFGPRAFAAGMVAWIGYFVTLFLQLRPAMLGLAVLGVATATVSLLVEMGYYPDPSLAYMYHCHMLNHEDSGMMGQFVIVEPGQEADLDLPAGHGGH